VYTRRCLAPEFIVSRAEAEAFVDAIKTALKLPKSDKPV
jgi:hypothetical protein